MSKAVFLVRFLAAAGALTLLGGCDMVVMNPMGDIALQQRDLVIIATVLMLLIVVPVIALVALVAWRYRASNTEAHYEPDWDHSTMLELVIWSAPLLIIICLGAITWTGTHLLDPYRPLERVAAGRPVAAGTKPLEVQVVSLDWKWLFIYPEYGIATVNELAAPVDRPIHFRLTSSSVMNAFYVPTLAGMIYTMPSMETQLHAVINKAGNYEGFSSNYSGAGFSGMRFRFYGVSDAEFAGWVARIKAGGGELSRARYLELEKPTEKVPVMRFASVAPGLFDATVNQCVKPGTACMSDLMKMDMGHDAGMEHMPGMAMPPGKKAEEPLTTGGAGGPPPAKPADVQQRTPSEPSNAAAPHHHAN
ncbi:MAG: ubiquinol oxidase subunit II [Sphingomonas sp.]